MNTLSAKTLSTTFEVDSGNNISSGIREPQAQYAYSNRPRTDEEWSQMWLNKLSSQMKTGRSLPKVYSEEDIRNILTAHENIKHQLVLYLAYGCGSRLNEIRLLKPGDFDLVRKVIRIESGKGNKDRFVMIDPALEKKENSSIFKGQQRKQVLF